MLSFYSGIVLCGHCIRFGFYIVRADMSDVKELVTFLRRSGANVNQIARCANEMNSLYAEDVADPERHYGVILDGLNRLLKKWNEL